MREIRAINRCTRCGSVIAVLVHDQDLDEEGNWRELVHWLPRREHGDDECSRLRVLFKEEWPQLW